VNRSDLLQQHLVFNRTGRWRSAPPGVIAGLRHARHARHRRDREIGLIRAHEFEDPDGTAPVSRANQAAARCGGACRVIESLNDKRSPEAAKPRAKRSHGKSERSWPSTEQIGGKPRISTGCTMNIAQFRNYMRRRDPMPATPGRTAPVRCPPGHAGDVRATPGHPKGKFPWYGSGPFYPLFATCVLSMSCQVESRSNLIVQVALKS
jgi:hypothetical protein